MDALHLQKDLGLCKPHFPSNGIGEVRPYAQMPGQFSEVGWTRPSLRLVRLVQESSVFETKNLLLDAADQIWPTLRNELQILGSLEQAIKFDLTSGGRSLISQCYAGRYLSIVIRKEDKDSGLQPYVANFTQAAISWGHFSTSDAFEDSCIESPACLAVDNRVSEKTYSECARKGRKATRKFTITPSAQDNVSSITLNADQGGNYWSNNYVADTSRTSGPQENFAFSFEAECRAIFDILPKGLSGKPPMGVIIIAGGTGSGKSEITRGLIHRYLLGSVAGKEDNGSHPHLLTVENPIEKYLFTDQNGNPIGPAEVQTHFCLDYTPRQIPEDTPSLEQALMQDALRQTPTLTYVGEIREAEEFKTVLDFAETGHAVITTMHAGSLREAMRRILTSCDATTPARRGEIASRITAVIHLQPMPRIKSAVDGNNEEYNVTLPAVWRRTNSAITNLVADGLSSISPTARGNDGQRQEAYCLGRYYFLRKLIGKDPQGYNMTDVTKAAHLKDMDMSPAATP